MILLVDNYDSFTYNIYQYLGMLTKDIQVLRNDKVTVEQVRDLNPAGIVISPGPGRPEDGAASVDIVREMSGTLPILGVCLGHQIIGQVNGGTVNRAGQIMHGKVSEIEHDGKGVFEGLPSPFTATRYHGLVIDTADFPEDKLEITARTADGVVMGVRHRRHANLHGVQFHPESILTDHGMTIMENFVRICGVPMREKNAS